MGLSIFLSARFELLRTLGRGGMGVVYAAYDNERRMPVALKQLRWVDPGRVYRFKREFRALSDLSHPNIVQLYELVTDEHAWFLTMEIVDGVDFMSYVRGADVEELAEEHGTRGLLGVGTRSNATTAVSVGDVTRTSRWQIESPAPAESLSSRSSVSDVPLAENRPDIVEVVVLERVTSALAQLAEALHALHSTGVIHRDLKPSNVLVDGAGRVVLMDFGMVAESRRSRVEREGAVMGTPLYMAPEQALGQPVDAGADWYAFGVMMYEALCGRPPQRGTAKEVLRDKLTFEPVPPSAWVDGVPPELEHLCLDLLAKRAGDRPSGIQVIEHLGGRAALVDAEPDEIFVGRERELAALERAFASARQGPARTVVLRGLSGIGKSRIIDQFLSSTVDAAVGSTAVDNSDVGARPLLLSSRCHERESLPYRAFDGVIDEVCLHLLDMPAAERERLLPDDVAVLAHVFPILNKLPEIDCAQVSEESPLLKARALFALRALIVELARWRPLIIRIEDCHWSDLDSRDAMAGILQPPVPERLLIVATARSEPEYTDALQAMLDAMGAHAVCDVIAVGPLASDEERALLAHLSARHELTEEARDSVLTACTGHPMLLAELVRYLNIIDVDDSVRGPRESSVETLIWRRVRTLTGPSRELVEAACIAGEPTPLWMVASASRLQAFERERALAETRSLHLLRVTRSGTEPWIDVYHDKVREAVCRQIDAERARVLHQQIARILTETDDVPAARIAMHRLGAGERISAVMHLWDAARVATRQLAFDLSSRLYQQALALIPSGDDEPELTALAVRLRVEFATALRRIEHGDEALEQLALAEIETRELGMLHELATVHYLRGSVLFPRGDVAGCMREHRKARELARLGGSVECEAHALSGLGDAHYLQWNLRAGIQCFDDCLALIERHGLTSMIPVNQAMRGVLRTFQIDAHQGEQDCQIALNAAIASGSSRIEMVVRACAATIAFEAGVLDASLKHVSRMNELAERLGVSRFQAFARVMIVFAYGYEGRVVTCDRELAESERLLDDVNRSFIEPVVWVAHAMMSREQERARYLERGRAALARGALAHNHIMFHRQAMEIGLEDRDRALVERSIDALRTFDAKSESNWVAVWIARARLLMSVHGERLNDERRKAIEAVIERARHSGYELAVPRLMNVLQRSP